MMQKTWIIIGGSVLLPNVGGFMGGFITRSQIKGWYEGLNKPSWRPPNWLFGPMWTTLYSSMGYASYLVWRDGGGFDGDAKLALTLYGTNLALNWMWTPIFFGSHKLGLAFGEICVLWLNIAGCLYTFYPINKTAAGLLLPYLGWVTLATALNYKMWQMNKPAIKNE
ncbi:translocator protein-like [Acropora muricata]|uniref:translocator protein-like n=1 Tax=Acropora millepora TaxID=45264 RepID=UPI001CF1C698|nr:translocator protein-like [Acropora millepora]XP_029200804.2 translocator protein-like [Acropora millepora]